MPYIKQERRTEAPTNAGELNFWLTQIIVHYLKEKGTSYATMNDIVGALECCKLEFARRVMYPYEDKKREENGDVYEK